MMMIVTDRISCRFGIRAPLPWLHMLGIDHPAGRRRRGLERVHFEGVLRVERLPCLSAPDVFIPAATVVAREFQRTDGCAFSFPIRRNFRMAENNRPIVKTGSCSEEFEKLFFFRL